MSRLGEGRGGGQDLDVGSTFIIESLICNFFTQWKLKIDGSNYCIFQYCKTI